MKKLLKLLKSKKIKYLEYFLNILFFLWIISLWIEKTDNYIYNVVMTISFFVSLLISIKKEKIELYIKLKLTNILLNRKK